MREGFTTDRPAYEKDRADVDVIDTLLVLSKHKQSIAWITGAAALLALVIALLLPRMYTAKASLLTPQQNQPTLTSLLGQFGVLAGVSGKDLGISNPSDLFVAMLKSRTVEDRLVDRFDLRKVYGVRYYEDARGILEKRSDISAGDEGLISVSVSDRDRDRAAQLANAYIDELHSLNAGMAITEAAHRRLFYEQKLAAEREDLAQAELSLKQTEEKSGFIQPEAQGRAIIETVADMRAKVAAHEVQLQAMRTWATENNPELKRAERELAGLRTQLAKLERDTGEAGDGNLEVPTRRLPQAGLEYIRRARDVKYHEALYEFLGKQLEAARIDEARDAILVQVVDKAVLPEKPSGPRRLLIVLATTIAAFLLACAGTLGWEIMQRKAQARRNSPRLALLRHYLRTSSEKM
ncbi:MAG TPA: GNVR domain-containing protein [Candidatus Binatia bacterium]|nr:GNVR domain-containing protein [Candidatus Binatia bacterium]